MYFVRFHHVPCNWLVFVIYFFCVNFILLPLQDYLDFKQHYCLSWGRWVVCNCLLNMAFSCSLVSTSWSYKQAARNVANVHSKFAFYKRRPRVQLLYVLWGKVFPLWATLGFTDTLTWGELSKARIKAQTGNSFTGKSSHQVAGSIHKLDRTSRDDLAIGFNGTLFFKHNVQNLFDLSDSKLQNIFLTHRIVVDKAHFFKSILNWKLLKPQERQSQ